MTRAPTSQYSPGRPGKRRQSRPSERPLRAARSGKAGSGTRNRLLTWVSLIQAYSKRRDLADALACAVHQLRQAQAPTREPASGMRSTVSHRQWRVGARLSEADMERLLVAFTAGTSKRKVAERYGISESSVKRLIRQHGASKPSRGLYRHFHWCRSCGAYLTSAHEPVRVLRRLARRSMVKSHSSCRTTCRKTVRETGRETSPGAVRPWRDPSASSVEISLPSRRVHSSHCQGW
jgi:hypothetical protein